MSGPSLHQRREAAHEANCAMPRDATWLNFFVCMYTYVYIYICIYIHDAHTYGVYVDSCRWRVCKYLCMTVESAWHSLGFGALAPTAMHRIIRKHEPYLGVQG